MGNNYLGNPNLKAAGVQLEFDHEQVQEFLKCARDPIYFFENYIKIVNVDLGIIKFQPWEFQKEMVQTCVDNRFVIVKWPRQQGKTTTVAGLLLWYVLFNDNYNIALLAHKAEQAREIMSRIQMAYENLPLWLQQGVMIWNKGNIELENGSKIRAAATSSGSVRGQTFNIVYMDELAHVELGVQEEFFTSTYPVISSGKTTKIIITSTPNGFEMFYKLWTDSEEGRNNYVRHEAFWWDVPTRDEKWKEETIRNTSQRQFDQEFNTEFLGSTNTLIDPPKLRNLVYRDPLFTQTNVAVYKRPEPNHTYICCVDTSEGLNLDYHAFSITDVTKVPYEVVAVFRDNRLAPILLPNIIHNTCKIYNDALVLCETQTNGLVVANILMQDLEYENVLATTTKGKKGQTLSGGFGGTKLRLGVMMNKQVKRIGCSNLKALIEGDKLITNDFRIKQELMRFVADNKNSFSAEEGYNDDLVMTLVLLSWMATQEYFRELSDTHVRDSLLMDNMESIEQDVTPFGIIDDGDEISEDGWTIVKQW